MKFQVVLAIILIILGTGLTLYGGYILSNQGTKELKIQLANQAHPIPDVLYLDLNFKSKVNDYINDSILNKAYSKTYLPNGDAKDMDSLHLSIFFDEVNFKNNPTAKKNFDIQPSFTEKLKEIEIMGYISSTKNNSAIQFSKNASLLSTSTRNINEYGSIEVKNYDKKSDDINFSLHDYQMALTVTSNTESLLDFDGGKIKIIIVTAKEIEISNISDITIKTKRSKYFKVININKSELGEITGQLKRIIQ